MNPEIECEHCGEMIPINEENHVLAHCRASFAGTPVPTKDREYIFVKLNDIMGRKIGLMFQTKRVYTKDMIK